MLKAGEDVKRDGGAVREKFKAENGLAKAVVDDVTLE